MESVNPAGGKGSQGVTRPPRRLGGGDSADLAYLACQRTPQRSTQGRCVITPRRSRKKGRVCVFHRWLSYWLIREKGGQGGKKKGNTKNSREAREEWIQASVIGRRSREREGKEAKEKEVGRIS